MSVNSQSKVLEHCRVCVLDTALHAPQEPQLHVSAVQLGGGGVDGSSHVYVVAGEGVSATAQSFVFVHVLVRIFTPVWPHSALQAPHDHVSSLQIGREGVMTVVYGVPP